MSEIKVNKITPKQNCTQVTLGDSGDDIVVATGVNLKTAAVKDASGNVIISRCGSNITIGSSGASIALACGASQTGFGRTGTVDWDTTAKTASFTAVSGNGYFVNTTSGAITVTLPAGSAGSIVSLKDYANTWNTNNVTVTPNGTDKINGINANATLKTQDQSVTLVYVDSTKGWRAVQDSTSDITGGTFITATGGTITTCGNCKIHTFTGPGTFTVCSVASCAPNNVVSYLVVAGGGSGGSSNPGDGSGGGGGGAGGFREYKSPVTPYTASPLDGNPGGTAITVTAQGYPIIVGGGGSGVPAPSAPNQGNDGNPSVFSTITSTAGGGGGGGANVPNLPAGRPGGSGGGAGNSSGSGTAGSGNTPPVSPPQGNNGGGISPPGTTPNYGSGGGGGAGGTGTNGTNNNGGPGGNGATTSINGTPTTRAGGGGGGVYAGGVPVAGNGGPGGGGDGGGGSSRAATNGSTNTGSGGGGLSFSACTSGNGGSGIVIIRYKFQ